MKLLKKAVLCIAVLTAVLFIGNVCVGTEAATKAPSVYITWEELLADGCEWDYSEEFTYDGAVHTVELTGAVLEKVHVEEYLDNSAERAGEYTAKAVLSSDYVAPGDGQYIVTCNWKIGKADYDMSGVTWGDDEPDFYYDGEIKTVELSGLPEGVSVSYSDNLATNAGTYSATAVIDDYDDVNYNCPVLLEPELEWSISKATFNMQNVKWDYPDTPFIYDGTEKTVSLTGLPEGIEVVFSEGYSAKNAGTYRAYAELVYDEDNYYTPKPAAYSLIWSISKADYDLSGVCWDYEEAFTYDGTLKEIRLTGLPEGIEVSYVGNIASNAWEYKAYAYIMHYDRSNYNEPILGELESCEWKIEKADLGMSGVYWDYDESLFVYDGSEKKVEIVGLPEGVTAEYSGNTGTEAGTYEASVVLTIDIPEYYNYITEIPETFSWTIAKAEIDFEGTGLENASFVYDGLEHEVTLTGIPENIVCEIEGERAEKAGKYELKLTVTEFDENNYEKPEPMCFEWEILKADYDMSPVEWDYSGAFTDDGNEHSVALKGLPEGVGADYSGNRASEAGTYRAVAEITSWDEENYNRPELKADSLKWRIGDNSDNPGGPEEEDVSGSGTDAEPAKEPEKEPEKVTDAEPENEPAKEPEAEPVAETKEPSKPVTVKLSEVVFASERAGELAPEVTGQWHAEADGRWVFTAGGGKIPDALLPKKE